MDIEDAFTQEAIVHYDTNVEGELETALQDVLQRIYQGNEINWSEDIMKVAMLAFVAGRTYQADQQAGPITIEMTPQTAQEFIQFLAEKGAT